MHSGAAASDNPYMIQLAVSLSPPLCTFETMSNQVFTDYAPLLHGAEELRSLHIVVIPRLVLR